VNELVVSSNFVHRLSAITGGSALPSTMALLRATLERHRALTATAAGVVVLAALTVTLDATADAREQRWRTGCEGAGGRVAAVERVPSNPLVSESDDPVLHCLGPDGAVRGTR
jgi:hypothetical protein